MKRAAAAVALFALSCLVLWHGGPDGDVVELRGYGHAVLDGQLPYRDFYLEYPPGAIPLFTLPALGEFITWFRVENAIGWAAVIVLVSLLTRRAWPPFAVALVPLALGPFTLMRFDAWPTALALGALLALVRGRPTLALVLLALGGLVKVWPLVLLPLFALYAPSRRALVLFAGVLTLGLAPFVALAPAGSYNALAGQLHRPLEFETIAASILFALGVPTRIFFDSGSWNVRGSGAHALATVHGLVELAALVAVCVVFARSRRTRADLVAAAAAAVAVVAILGKVLSPQYLLWVAPFAALADLVASVPLAAACLATQALHESWFGDLLSREPGAVAVLALRNALLVATVVLLLRRTGPV
jgi:Glycosyltransferase family 87